MTAAKSTPGPIVRAQLARVARRVRKAAKSQEDPEAVHDLRVAIRHFRQSLRLFPEVYEHAFARKVKRRLKKMMTALGAVRNRDIAPEILNTAKAAPDEALLKILQDQRQEARKRLASELKSWENRDLLREWKAELQPDGGTENARLQLPGLAGAFFTIGNSVARQKVPYRQLHRCRLLGKRLRYSIEMLGLEDNRQFKNRFHALKLLQNQLGELNDCVTVLALIPGHAAARKRLRLLCAQKEKAFRAFWKRKFNQRVQEWWLHALIPDATLPKPAKRAET